ncbi:unnamed protein product [Closterium sp. NIES-65]|nr:unnamed protein product [Closterium sp. NIES-65]
MRYTAASIAASGGSGAAEALADKAVGGGGGGGYGEHGPVVGAGETPLPAPAAKVYSACPLPLGSWIQVHAAQVRNPQQRLAISRPCYCASLQRIQHPLTPLLLLSRLFPSNFFSSHRIPVLSAPRSPPCLALHPASFRPPLSAPFPSAPFPFAPLPSAPLALHPSSFRPPCPPPLFPSPPSRPPAALRACHGCQGLLRRRLSYTEVDLIVDGRLPCMVRERTAEQAPASGQQGGTGEGGAVHEAPSAVGVGGGALAPTIDTEIIGASYGQFKFGVEHISVTPLLEGRHDLTAKGDDETAESYCNRARTIRAELLTIGKEVHMATFAAHVLKGLPPEYGFLCRKLEFSSPDMTVERVCSEVLMEEQTLSIEQSYKQITSDASAFLGAVNAIVATTGVNGKEGKGGREQTDKKKDGKWEKK